LIVPVCNYDIDSLILQALVLMTATVIHKLCRGGKS